MLLQRNEAIRQLDQWSLAHTPFFFFTDFEGTCCWASPLSALNPSTVEFDFTHSQGATPPPFSFQKHPISFQEFLPIFNQVVHEIRVGNSFLVNLTFQTPIQTNLSLREIYAASRARYKVRFQDQFVFFSPETFVKIADGRIFSFPMKGTISASVPNAQEKVLADPKETAEHVTIVDLIRNDLSQVAESVQVDKFRYVTQVHTHEKTLLQVSSAISGQVRHEFSGKIGSLLFQLLPAGSISGAPKPKTLEIIRTAENYQRGFYTGICGYFDGESLDSAVMIRFIEKIGDQLFYKSGGGITSFSDAHSEYQEIVDKVYLPFA